MTTTPNMLIDKPVLGGDAGTWDDKINAAIDTIDAHDHSIGRGTTVKTAGISINADLTFSSLYAPINLHRITFASIVALTGNNKSLFVNTADNELYWRSNAGTNVKLTSGAALNVAAFTGGIGGDYTAVGAALNFDDAGDRYTLKQQSNLWARMASGDVRLFETGTTDSVFVGLAAPAALAGSYTITMPLAAPAATRPVQMSSAGVLTAGDADNVAIGGTLAITGTTTAAAINSGAITSTSTVATTGSNLTSNAHRVQLKAPAALAADYDVTMPGALPAATQVMRMSSTGVVTAASASETRLFASAAAVPSGLGGVRNGGGSTGGGFIALGVTTGVNWLPLNVSVGEVITAWAVGVSKTSATGTITASLVEANFVTETFIGASATNGANNPGNVFLTISGLSATVATNRSYWIQVFGGGTTGDTIVQYQLTVTVSP